MRKYYLDNIRWITSVLVVIYHVIYMFNGVQLYRVIGPFGDVQYQDSLLYLLHLILTISVGILPKGSVKPLALAMGI